MHLAVLHPTLLAIIESFFVVVVIVGFLFFFFIFFFFAALSAPALLAATERQAFLLFLFCLNVTPEWVEEKTLWAKISIRHYCYLE